MQSKEERCEMKGIRAATLRWSKKMNAGRKKCCSEDLPKEESANKPINKSANKSVNKLENKLLNKPANKKESLVAMVWRCRKDLRAYSGQGTTEYAILVGVLVVIAILAITVFRPRLQELWDSIASGINSL